MSDEFLTPNARFRSGDVGVVCDPRHPFWVKGQGRLIQQHKRCVQSHRAADADALRLAAGQRGGVGSRLVRQPGFVPKPALSEPVAVQFGLDARP